MTETATQPQQATSHDGRFVNPFKPATEIKKRLKAFFWGDTGTGKTILALHFPAPAVIDLERGTDFYAKRFRLDDPTKPIEFDRLPVTDLASIEKAIDWLLTSEHQYQTLIIDPITILWEALQKRWSDRYLKYNRGTKGWKNEYYELQVKDWLAIKADLKDLIRKLLALDMNVIVTAREKALYKEGAFMERVGETFDGEKALPYMFDVVLRTQKTQVPGQVDKYFARCLKDRTDTLPKGDFENSYQVFQQAFGESNLSRPSKPFNFATQEQVLRIQELAVAFGILDDKLRERLASYGAQTVEDLSQENASVIISKLDAAIRAREDSQRKAAASQATPPAAEQPVGTQTTIQNPQVTNGTHTG